MNEKIDESGREKTSRGFCYLIRVKLLSYSEFNLRISTVINRFHTLSRAITWVVLSSLLSATIAYQMTGDREFVLAFTLLDFAAKLLLFVLHEAFWSANLEDAAPAESAPVYELEPCVIWFTGLPSSGKTTLCLLLKEYLESISVKMDHLDGDAVRAVVPGIGFSRNDRNDHIRRMGFLASRLESQGISVITSFVSPYRESRNFVRKMCKNFLEIHLSTSIAECTERDVKGLYKEAQEGKRSGMTGVDDPYEAPENAELVLDTATLSKEACLQAIQNLLRTRGLLREVGAENFLMSKKAAQINNSDHNTGAEVEHHGPSVAARAR